MQKLYGGDLNELNNDLDKALASKNVISTIQKDGKQNQYGIGTVAAVKHAARLIFFLA
ncbi:macro domain-containing protein [Acetobacter pasteurianus]|uniref:macro domain-containing protein n=1 Tax=Acetobacter TaxID=434 RepID=UPI000B1C7458